MDSCLKNNLNNWSVTGLTMVLTPGALVVVLDQAIVSRLLVLEELHQTRPGRVHLHDLLSDVVETLACKEKY